ncbi:MAG: PEP-CTERM sorting domain-containing protein [Planctomycetota bacterium]
MNRFQSAAVILQLVALPVIAQHAHVGPTVTGGTLDMKTGYYPSENFAGGPFKPTFYLSPLPILGGSDITNDWAANGNSTVGLTFNDGDYYLDGVYNYVYNSVGWTPNYFNIDPTTRYAIHNGEAPQNGSIVTAVEVGLVNDGRHGGHYDGWYEVTTPLNPTTDFFAADLNGLDVYYEIVDITPVSGNGSNDAIFAIFWESHGGGSHEMLTASSDSATQLERSLHTPPPTHRHGYEWYISDPGEYDITWRVWDANGLALTDAPGGISDTRFRISVVPEPTSLGLLGIGGLLLFRQKRA